MNVYLYNDIWTNLDNRGIQHGLKPRSYPKQGYQWSKKGLMSFKSSKRNVEKCISDNVKSEILLPSNKLDAYHESALYEDVNKRTEIP